MLNTLSILALFTLLIVCSFAFFISKKIKIPYTVFLVMIGLIIVPIANLPILQNIFGFIDNFQLTPNLLFFIFLPILLFESAFNMNIRKIIDNLSSISSLAVVGLLISSFIIATILYFVFPLIGLQIPFIILLLFASIISSTDPVAVLALFKEYNAPKRLSLIFEGESLFNDGTAVALFLVVLGIANSGFHGSATIIHGILTFTSMVFIGILFGIFTGMIFSQFLKYTKSNEFVSITLLLVSAHFVFILSEIINQNPIFNISIHISPIIATTFAALFLGNYARYRLSPESDEYIEKSISHLAFIVNSLVFILIGILFGSSSVVFVDLWLPILITIITVATARAISVYISIYPINKLKLEQNISTSWQHLLSWGSLRGALAIVTVLLIPDNFTISNWQLPYSPKEFIIALTTGCILFTLLIKANSIKWLMNKLNIVENDKLDIIKNELTEKICLLNEKKKLIEHLEKGFIMNNDDNVSNKLIIKLNNCIQKHEEKINNLMNSSQDKNNQKIAIQLIAINIEEHYLKELYINNEISEKIYRRIRGKLNLQKEKIELDELNKINLSKFSDYKDVFDVIMAGLQILINKKRNNLDNIEKLEYYRAQSIISRKVIKNLNEINQMFNVNIFDNISLDYVLSIYKEYKEKANEKLQSILNQNNKSINNYINYLNELSLNVSKNKSLHYLETKGYLNEQELEKLLHSH